MQSLFKYTSAATARTIIQSLRLRWSSPLAFNDPYDATQDLRLSYGVAEINSALAHELADAIESLDPDVTSSHLEIAAILAASRRLASVAERRDFAQEVRGYPGEPTEGQIDALTSLERLWKESVPTFRVLCLSEANDVTPMWLHYSDGYKGVVLEFGCMDETDSPLLLARKVEYQNGPVVVGNARAWARCSLGLSGNTWEFLLKECVYVKAKDWQYEHEWRTFTYAADGDKTRCTDTPFNPMSLRRVYFGVNCSAVDQQEIRALLVGPLAHVEVLRARRDPVRGKFVFEPLC